MQLHQKKPGSSRREALKAFGAVMIGASFGTAVSGTLIYALKDKRQSYIADLRNASVKLSVICLGLGSKNESTMEALASSGGIQIYRILADIDKALSYFSESLDVNLSKPVGRFKVTSVKDSVGMESVQLIETNIAHQRTLCNVELNNVEESLKNALSSLIVFSDEFCSYAKGPCGLKYMARVRLMDSANYSQFAREILERVFLPKYTPVRIFPEAGK